MLDATQNHPVLRTFVDIMNESKKHKHKHIKQDVDAEKQEEHIGLSYGKNRL